MKRLCIIFALLWIGMVAGCKVSKITNLKEELKWTNIKEGLELKESPLMLSKVIFPEQEIPFRFFHNKHVRLGMQCTFCHEKASQSIVSSDSLIPEEKLCRICHNVFSPTPEKVFPKATCDTCHPGFDKTKQETPLRIKILNPNINFNHKVHVDNKIECQRCHGDMKTVELATREHLPSMDSCLECHNEITVVNNVKPSKECITCHIADKSGLMHTAFAAGDLIPGSRRPFYHDKLWFKNHRGQAEADIKTCQRCHRDNFCLNCHRGGFNERGGYAKPYFHPNNWIVMHTKQAYADTLDCTSCHRLELFCQDCHKRFMVNREKIPRGKSFHIQQWAAFPRRGILQVPQNHHSNFAKRNIQNCVTCHQERDCFRCHATIKRRGAGVSPHGSKFRRSVLKRRNKKVCLKCHTGNDPLIL